MRTPALGLATLMALCALPIGAQSVADARTAMRSGEYADAIEALRELLDADDSSTAARVTLMEALTITGAYEEAITLGEASTSAATANALGEALVAVGRWDDAETAFARAIANDPSWRLTAEANLAELWFDRGRVDEAMARFDRFIDVYNNADGRMSARDLAAVGRAVRYLGRTAPNLFQDALRAFDQAAAADPGWETPKILAGWLFLEKYTAPEARTDFEAVLAANPNHPDALFGIASVMEFDGSGDGGEPIGRLLEINPNHAGARALLARSHLVREKFDEARLEAQQVLDVNPRSLEALSALAAADYMSGDVAAFRARRAQVLSLNPRYAELDTRLAELSVQTRRYLQAVERANAAIGLDSAAWEAWGLLGMNELRIGRIEDGRAHLERAFAGDPHNPWFVNNLDLLDTFDRFETVATEHFELFLHQSEADVLATYLRPLVEEAYDSLSRRYGVEPALPVRAEFYNNHADFSVRTLGETGLGALGVSFGNVLVMDAPSARERGDYNWASVFWHELSHTFHLALTDNRVPRWFSEGLSVHEQRKGRAGWGHQPSLQFVQAIREGRLKKVSELNDGFMRPDYPQQVVFSYLEASLVFQVIEDRWGFQAIRDMLTGYGEGRTTEELFESVLGEPIEDFDDEFDEYLAERFAAPLAALAPLGEAPPAGADINTLATWVRMHPGDLFGRLRLGSALVTAERFSEAEPHFQSALRMFPEYGGADSPYWFLAAIHRKEGDLERAAAALSRLNGLSEANYTALVEEAEVLGLLGRLGESAAVLDKAVQVWPYDIALHERLADLHASLGNYGQQVLERQAIVALEPVDKAEAFYALAVAHRDAGQRTEARRAVLRSLDIAPNYEQALELLLELRAGTQAGTRAGTRAGTQGGTQGGTRGGSRGGMP